MAASLRNLMSRLCTQARTTLSCRKPLFSSPHVEPTRHSLIPQNAFHTTPVSSVTYELKQWREHRVIHRFYRLHWGAWIRCFGGRHKGLYKKTDQARWLLKQHVFCTRTQSRKLDILVTAKWRKPMYFADSPYEPYQIRNNCPSFPNHKKFYP